MTLLSARLAAIRPSPTITIAALARRLIREGRPVLDFSEGEADFPTPDFVKSAAMDAIRTDQTRYTDVAGTPLLKAAIRRKFARDNDLDYGDDEVTAGAGAKQIIFNAFMATLDPGDEVIVPAPHWVSYPDMVRLAGGSPVVVRTSAETGFKLTPKALADAIGVRTKWLVLCSPGNPTGAVYSAEELAALTTVLATASQVAVLSDDIYEPLVYPPNRFATIAQVDPALKPRVLTVNGVSKSHAMTGWRLGYAGGPSELIGAMNTVQGQSTTHASSISQAAAVAALDGPQEIVAEWRVILEARRDRALRAIASIPLISCAVPQGAFYLWVDVRRLFGLKTPAGEDIATDSDVAAYLLQSVGIVSVPGTAFGLQGYLRFCFAKPDRTLDALGEQLARAITAL